MDTAIKAALISAAVSAVALLGNNYLQNQATKEIERQKDEFSFLQFTVNNNSHNAYCNLKLWQSAKIFTDIDVQAVMDNLKVERNVSTDCKDLK